MKTLTYFLFFTIAAISCIAQEPIFKNYSIAQCDSLIQANSSNPNFVILDIRTAGEYNPDHLEGAIMRDYYADDFSEQLSVLNKEKTYLMHCRSGARSGAAMGILPSLGFKEVYNMLGGIKKWKNQGHNTTNAIDPKIALVSDSIVHIGSTIMDNGIEVSITNRANGVLKVQNITGLDPAIFTTNFESNTEILGGTDYNFTIEYQPNTIALDTFSITIESNAGSEYMTIYQNTILPIVSTIIPSITLYPNPVNHTLNIDNNNVYNEVIVTNSRGEIFQKNNISKATTIDISRLTPGVYILNFRSRNHMISKKIVIK